MDTRIDHADLMELKYLGAEAGRLELALRAVLSARDAFVRSLQAKYKLAAGDVLKDDGTVEREKT